MAQEITLEELRALTLDTIAKQPKNMYAAHGVRVPGHSNYSMDVMHAVTDYLHVNGFIKEKMPSFVLDRKGIDAMDMGGLIPYLERERQQQILDAKAKEATVKGTIWNRRGIIIAGVFSVIATGISIYSLTQDRQLKKEMTDASERAAIASQSAELSAFAMKALLTETEMLVKRANATADSLRAELLHLQSNSRPPHGMR